MSSCSPALTLIKPPIIGLVACLFALIPSANAGSVVSLDVCADQYVLSLAEPQHIKRLSVDSTSAFSFLQDQARPYPTIRPRLESILALSPDLIVRQWGGDARLLNRLQAQGKTILQLEFASTFTDILASIEHLGAALGQTEAASHLQNRLRASLPPTPTGAKKRILYVTPGGVTAAGGTMIDAIIQAAGLINVASEAGASGWPALPAEALVRNPPDLILAGFFDSPLEKTSNWSAARHPVFAGLFVNIPTIKMPASLISCAGPQSFEAARWLRRAVDEVDSSNAPSLDMSSGGAQ